VFIVFQLNLLFKILFNFKQLHHSIEYVFCFMLNVSGTVNETNRTSSQLWKTILLLLQLLFSKSEFELNWHTTTDKRTKVFLSLFSFLIRVANYPAERAFAPSKSAQKCFHCFNKQNLFQLSHIQILPVSCL